MSPLQLSFIGIIALLGVGLYALLASRNLIKIIIALQIMTKSAILALVVAGNATGRINLSQSIALTVIVVDTIVAVLALALVVQIKRQTGHLDAAKLTDLRH
ncbi:MAG: NADH-quinone oxidoreductase subunit K [Anaerolineae bacterium]|nr:NADH-quinone oxidoreductase subunit K [Anaerolineae bacterium]HNS40574.1 NADH-quinone oxidoreductase subunit K [Promineifilum sp.]